MQTSDISPLYLRLLEFDVSKRERDESNLGRVEVFESEGETGGGRRGGEGADGGLVDGTVDEVS